MKVLTDWQSRASFGDLLRQLGWDVITAQQTGLDGRTPDYKLVEYAHADKRIFFTFDYLMGEDGALVAKQVSQYGGKVLKIRGGPEQDPYRAVGRVLFHYPDWWPFLERQNGVAEISDTKNNCRCHTPSAFLLQAFPTGAQQFEKYLARQRKRRADDGRPRKTTPVEQHHMDLNG